MNIKKKTSVSFIFLILIQIYFVNTSVSSEKENNSFNTIKNSKTLARIVSAQHYKGPIFEDVLRHSSNTNRLNLYLRELDPYSKFIPSEQWEYSEKRAQKYRVGAGLDFLVNKNKVLAVPITGGPAYKAGITTPVFVHQINGQKLDIKNFSSYRDIAYMEVGDSLILDYKKTIDSDKVTRILLSAEQIKRDAVSVSANGSSLVLQVRDIRRGAIYRIKNALTLASRQQRLLIDLRYSPGGDIYALVDWLSLLLNDDIPVITLLKQSTQNKRKKNRSITLTTLPGKVEMSVPIVIAISEYTASSAEIFARILRSQIPGTIVVGWPSKGKCLAQSTYALASQGALKLSTYNVELLDSGICEGNPIQPDILEAGIETHNLEQIHQLVDQIKPVTLP